NALDSHAEGKTLVAVGIDAAILKDLRMHHAAAQDLQPILAGSNDELSLFTGAADIHLGGGLGKGEVTGPESHRQVIDAEEGAAELDQRALQVPHVRLFVDHQAFDLVKHGAMGRVAISSIGSARGNDTDGRLV